MSQMKQSITWWSFEGKGMTVQSLVRLAAAIGYQGIELVDQEYWQLIKDHGLAIASVNGHRSIEEGLNRRENHARIEQELRAKIDLAAQWSIPNSGVD